MTDDLSNYFDHRQGCIGTAGRLPSWLGPDGLRRWTCSTCRLTRNELQLREQRIRQLEATGSASATVAAQTRYRCREHERPVNWKGRGCPICALDAAERKRKALARRRAGRRERGADD